VLFRDSPIGNQRPSAFFDAETVFVQAVQPYLMRGYSPPLKHGGAAVGR
jgi:hypothetical protein